MTRPWTIPWESGNPQPSYSLTPLKTSQKKRANSAWLWEVSASIIYTFSKAISRIQFRANYYFDCRKRNWHSWGRETRKPGWFASSHENREGLHNASDGFAGLRTGVRVLRRFHAIQVSEVALHVSRTFRWQCPYFQLYQPKRRGLFNRTYQEQRQRDSAQLLPRSNCKTHVLAAKASKMIWCNFFQITIPVTKSFVHYIKHQPMIFEVYGHYQPPVLHKVAIQDASNQHLQQVIKAKTWCQRPDNQGSKIYS